MKPIARRLTAAAVFSICAAAPLAAQPVSGGDWRCTAWRANKTTPQGRECSQWSSGTGLAARAAVPPPPFIHQPAPNAPPGGVPPKREKHRRHD